MAPFRVLFDLLPAPDSLCAVPHDQVHHLLHVRRCRAGDSVECIDRNGTCCSARIETVTPDAVTLLLNNDLRPAFHRPRICLVPALLPEKKFDWLLQKCTELGVDECRPVYSRRCVVKPARASHVRKIERWQRICDDAARQCGGAPMTVVQPRELSDCTLPDQWVKIIADPDGIPFARFSSILPPAETAIALLIGPEGGFAPDETTAASQAGWQPVCFHHTILRAETAAIVCSTLLMHML